MDHYVNKIFRPMMKQKKLIIDLFDDRKDYTQVLTVRNCELKGNKDHDFDMNVHDNLLMSYKEEQKQTEKRI